jgi:hypothetical protein
VRIGGVHVLVGERVTVTVGVGVIDNVLVLV